MNKFLKESEKKFFEEKQKFIRETLTYHLTENLKENEYEFKTKNNEPLTYNECSSSLCYTIEGCFLHGLKDSFLQILTSFGSDEDHKPTPSFWKFVQAFLHKSDIKDILALQQISTEIGYCRAFVRKAINDSLLSSYLQSIRKNPKSLQKYYHSYAFLYDNELSETAENLIRSIESCVVFNLPYNSSLLNSWQDKSLELSGIYTPALKMLPLPVGEDVVIGLATTANKDIPMPKPALPDIFVAEISNSIFSKSVDSLSELYDNTKFQRTLDKINSTEIADDIYDQMSQSPDEDDNEDLTENQQIATQLKHDNHQEERMQMSQDETTPENEKRYTMGNSLGTAGISWSEPVKEELKQPEEEPIINDDSKFLRRKASMRPSVVGIDNYRFESLLLEKQRQSSVNFQELWSKFNKTLNNQKQPNTISEEDEIESDGFEVLDEDKEKLGALQVMVEILCRLSTECGLDAQGFQCKECKSPLIERSKAIVCGFDGFYYCSECISIDKYAIPARIIYNWDFTQYSISKRAADFFANHQFKPFIDFKILNPDIYSFIEEMNKLQKLRIQLNFIRAYIFTCSESTIVELQKLLYGKEYIYETIHLYSVADLFLIQNGSLEEMLKKVVAFGREHCMKCGLCKEKGYHCEYCRKSKIIYPFDVDEVMRCNQCGSVSHLKCHNPLIPCPKCERKIRRTLSTANELES